MKDTYRKAMEIWEVPEVFYEAAIPMYRDHEAELAVRFGRDPISGQSACSLRVIRGMCWKSARMTLAKKPSIE